MSRKPDPQAPQEGQNDDKSEAEAYFDALTPKERGWIYLLPPDHILHPDPADPAAGGPE